MAGQLFPITHSTFSSLDLRFGIFRSDIELSGWPCIPYAYWPEKYSLSVVPNRILYLAVQRLSGLSEKFSPNLCLMHDLVDPSRSEGHIEPCHVKEFSDEM